MQAVILAGERGAPLYPLTARQPRAMLPLVGKPLVQYQLELLQKHAITEAILCLQVMPEAFESRFKEGDELGMTLRYHRELVPLGTAGAVRSVLPRLIEESILVLNGHNLTDADLTKLVALHQEREAGVTMLLAHVENPSRFGVVSFDSDGKITAFREKPAVEETQSGFVNAGVYMIRRDLLRRMPPDTEVSFERQLFPQLLAEGIAMYGMVNEGRYWRSIATLPDYQQAQADILERTVEATIGGNEVRQGVWVGANTTIHPTAILTGRMFINHHTEIGKDVRISGVCSIGSRCRIADGAIIEDSILWRGTTIEAGATVRGCILGDNCVVRAGANVQPGSVVGADAVIASVVAKLPSRGDIQRAAIKFGNDGWRGVIADDFTVDNVRIVTQALCNWLKSGAVPGEGLVIGYDRRSQSELFARSVAQVALANGIKIHLSDSECASAVVSFACRYYGASAGIMITASQNAPQWNGIKIKGHYGGAATTEMIAQIEEHLRQLLRSGAAPKTTRAIPPTEKITTPFLAHCRHFIDVAKIKKSGLSIVVDAMYGSAAGYFPELLSGGSSNIVEIRSERNPFFGGIHPEPIEKNMQPLFDAVRENNASIGISLGGDGDRLAACDAQGRYVDSHRIFAVLLQYLVTVKNWTGSVVRTVSTTRMLDKLCTQYGLPIMETPVGFRYISTRMLTDDVLLGGEESGGIGVKNHLPERDGVGIGALLLEAMAVSGKGLEELIADVYAEVGFHAYQRTNIFPSPERMPRIIAALQGLKGGSFSGVPLKSITRKDGTLLTFTDDSWLLLRPSGTEPVVRVYAESSSREQTAKLIAMGEELVR